jgi:hypothetical protein
MTALLLALAGCAPGPLDAPWGSTIEVPGDVVFSMDAGLVSPGDGYGHMFIADFYVHGPDYNQRDVPWNGIKVEILSGWTGAYVVPEEAVTIVTSYEEACAGAPVDDACHVYFDDENEYWVEFAGDYEDLGDFRPTYYSGATDNHGRLRTYVFVDSVPLDGNGSPVAIPMYASITGESQTFTLTPLSQEADE